MGEKDLKQRILERAEAYHLDETIINCILRMTEDEKVKLPDLLKAADYILGMKGDTSAEAVTVLAEDEDYSQYTEEELRTIQAQLEAYLKGESDGKSQETEPAPRPVSTPPSPSDRRSPPGTPEPETSGTQGLNLRLEDYLHG